MPDVAGLIRKHRSRGVFVDTNLLVLLLVGLVNAERVSRFKRTQDFTVNDFYLLEQLVGWFGAPLYSTPHVLSQVSDLTDLSGRELTLIRELFQSMVATARETFDSAKDLVANPMFHRFGLADASIAAVAKHNSLVLTSDLRLHIALESSGFDSLNFNHVRALEWFPR